MAARSSLGIMQGMSNASVEAAGEFRQVGRTVAGVFRRMQRARQAGFEFAQRGWGVRVHSLSPSVTWRS